MAQDQFKRHVAYKLRIGDVLAGHPVIVGERFDYLDLSGKEIRRVNVIGNVIEKYDSEGEKQYSFVTIDDASGQIKIKAFSDDVQKFNEITQGDTIIIIGVLRHFNNEVYIAPEIVKKILPEYLLVRKLETEKEKSKNIQPIEREKVIEIKDKIMQAIKEAETNQGIEIEEIIMKTREASPEIINQEIKKMLEEGIIFEPRPGRIRWLG
jgi:RPA family protein